jgi:hypothetical protein
VPRDLVAVLVDCDKVPGLLSHLPRRQFQRRAMKSREQSVPRARREGLLVQELRDEVLVYDPIRHKAHCLNQTAALVWNCCDGKTTVKQMVRLLAKETDSPDDEAVVWMAFDQLAKAHLLQSQTRKWPGSSGISRREVMRRIGTAAAVALPVVASITAPRAVQAGTCGPSGLPCTSPLMCCSGVCNAGTCV